MNKLFVWIPKTGGTSYFSKLVGMTLYLENDLYKFKNEGSACFGHIDVKVLLRGGVISKEYWENAEKFCVVRNPYDRFVSLYNDFLKSGRIFPDTSIRKFAVSLPTLTRRPGPYNVLDFSQTASQCEWIVPGVEIKRFEEVTKDLPHLNKSTDNHWTTYYDNEMLKIVTDLYYDDFALLGYKIYDNVQDIR